MSTTMQMTDNLFAPSAGGLATDGIPGLMDASMPPPATARTDLPDVISGGNPLVASANTLLNLIPQIRAMASNSDPEGFQRLLLANIREFERGAGAAGVPIEIHVSVVTQSAPLTAS